MKFFLSSPLSLFVTTLGVSAAPRLIVPRDVFAPVITSPNAGDVWVIGSNQTIFWDVSNPPEQITNPLATIILAKGGLLDIGNPLISGVDILAGKQTIIVPNVEPGSDYALVLIGDSGNFSPNFTISAVQSPPNDSY